VRIIPCAKARSVTLTDFFVALTVINGEQKISPKSDLKKIIFINSGHCRPNSFRLPRSGSGISICSKYVGITRSLAVRTLGIPNLLKCINKAQPEPCYKKTQLRSWSHVIKTQLRSHAYESRELRSRSHFIFTRAPQPWYTLNTQGCLRQSVPTLPLGQRGGCLGRWAKVAQKNTIVWFRK